MHKYHIYSQESYQIKSHFEKMTQFFIIKWIHILKNMTQLLMG